MKRSLSITLTMGLALACTASYAIEINGGRWWQPKRDSGNQERVAPQGQELLQQRIGIPTAVARYEWMAREAEEYTKKKADCKDEILYCINKLVTETKETTLYAPEVNGCIETSYPAKCAGVRVCDKTGEAVPYTPAPPKLGQTPEAYIYGQMVCAEAVFNVGDESYLDYKIMAPLLCSYPKDVPVKIKFSFSSSKEPHFDVCFSSNSGPAFEEAHLGKYFSITTVKDLLKTGIVYSYSLNKLDAFETAVANSQYMKSLGKCPEDALKAKACMLQIPVPGGIKNAPFVTGAVPGEPTIFPENYKIFDLGSHKVILQEMKIENVDSSFCAEGGNIIPYNGPNPNVCTVTVSLEKK